MTQRNGQVLQAIGDDGIIYQWYRRPYVRRINTTYQQEQQQEQQSSTQNETSPIEMLNPKQTKLSELGETILARCFQCMPINDRFNMEHVSRQFRAASKRSWIIQSHVIVVPEAVLTDTRYSIDGRHLFRILMKRCARYTVELTIHAMASKDRIFRLLHLSYRIENLCLDALSPICGSEIKEIGDRLPLLKSLIIRNCRIHFSFVRHFNSMLEQLQQLQVLAIIENLNFRCELEQLPRSIKIFCFRDTQMGDNIVTVLRNVRQRAPNISVLCVECGQGILVLDQVMAYEHLTVLCIPITYVNPEDVVPAEMFPVNYLEQLTALELGVVNEVFILMRMIPEMFPRLEHLSFGIIETTKSKFHEKLDPIIKFPVLRSFCFGVYQTGNAFVRELLYRKIDTNPLLFQGEYIAFVRKLFEQKKLEHLQLNFPLSTDMTIDIFKLCPNIRALYFYNRTGHIIKNKQDGDYFSAKEFSRRFGNLKQHKHPPNNEAKKIKMLERLFKGTTLEKGNEWIACLEEATPSHVLKELFIQQLGEEYINHPTQLFDIVRN